MGSAAHTFCISGARILPLGKEPGVLPPTDIWVSDKRIVAMSPPGTPSPFVEPCEIFRFENALVLPGLINAHSHSASTLQRGTVPGAPLDLFVMEAMSRRSKRSAHHVRIAALLHAVEMLKHGITGVVDHLRHGAMPSAEAVLIAMEAYDDIGMRAVVAPMFEDRPYIDSLPIEKARLPEAITSRWTGMQIPAPADYFKMLEEVLASRSNSRVKLMLGVDGPQRCSRDLLERAGDFARRHEIGLHTHLLEAKTQALMAPNAFGGSFVAYLDSFGLIGPRSSLAHFVWCSDRDIELAAERGVNVVNNPVSNLVLGSGIQPTSRLRAAGIPVALGTDGASSNAMSMFEQAKFSMLLSRICNIDQEDWITASQAIRMATEGGAAVLNEAGHVGLIAVGARADLAILDLGADAHKPLGDIWNHLVMYETGRSIQTVFVDGERVLDAGKCTELNEDDIYAEAFELAARDFADNAGSIETTRAERPVFKGLIDEALRRDFALNRFAHLN